MANSILFLLTLLRTAFKSALAFRADFLMQIFTMLLNDLVWIFIWWALFNKQPTIHNWNFNDLILMQGILLSSYALFSVFRYGLDDLPLHINNGNLDNFLVSPKNILLLLMFSKIKPSGLGDLIIGLIMFYFTNHTTWHNLPLIIIGIICATTTIFAFRLITVALSFWVNNMDNLGTYIFSSLLIFASQPATVFIGWYKLLIFTIMPAGFITLLPVEIIRHFDLTKFLLLINGSIVLLTFSVWLFYRGLRSYTSGNKFGTMS